MEQIKENASYSLTKEDFSKKNELIDIKEIPHLYDKIEELRKKNEIIDALMSSVRSEITNSTESGLIKPVETDNYNDYRFKLSKQINGRTFNVRIIDFKNEEALNRKLGLSNYVLNIESPFDVYITIYKLNGQIYDFVQNNELFRFIEQMTVDELFELTNNQLLLTEFSELYWSHILSFDDVLRPFYRMVIEAKEHYFKNTKRYNQMFLMRYSKNLSIEKIEQDVLLSDEYYKIAKIDLLFKAISENFNDLKFYSIGFDLKHSISILRNYQYFLTLEILRDYRSYDEPVGEEGLKEL